MCEVPGHRAELQSASRAGVRGRQHYVAAAAARRGGRRTRAGSAIVYIENILIERDRGRLPRRVQIRESGRLELRAGDGCRAASGEQHP